jgi:ParB family chromosome partitioning protein
MSQRRSALGRGLGALISNPNPRNESRNAEPTEPAPRTQETQYRVDTESGHREQRTEGSGLQELEIALIDPNPDQPRREFEQSALEQLALSIRQHGVLQPVVVRRAGPRYELVMGERRFRASQLAGRRRLPAVILDVDPADRLELAIVENVQRQDLNPIELAHAYQALADAGHTQEEIGRKVAMSRPSIANHIRLLDLSRTIQTDVEAGRLSLGHAKALLQVTDVEARESLRARIVNESLPVRAAERVARELNSGGRPTPSPRREKAPAGQLDPDTRAFVERVERTLQTKVHLHPAADGSGKLEINYFNLEDLERIGRMLLGETR